jgi:photosystem II stability/assembly factor-like uncharacterized protein
MLCLLSAGLLIPSLVHAKAAAPTNTIQVSGITMINQRFGWAVSANGPYHVYRTHQGSEHWNDVTPPLISSNPQTTITSSYFPNATRGYIGVVQNAPDAIIDILLSTLDGGKTWQTASFSFAQGFVLNQIFFVDAQHGWLNFSILISVMTGKSALMLMHTNDGGKTWQTILDSDKNPSGLSPADFQSTSFTFVNRQDGWATGLKPHLVYLYRTHDGGETWSKVNVMPIKGGSDVGSPISHGPYWQNSKFGTLYVDYLTNSTGMRRLTAYQTYDGGQSWILESASPSSSDFTSSFLNAQQGWGFAVDEQGQFILVHTSNGGKSWKLISPIGLPDPRNQEIGHLSFINARTGWVSIKDFQNNNWHLFQTDDGGHTWHELHAVVD